MTHFNQLLLIFRRLLLFSELLNQRVRVARVNKPAARNRTEFRQNEKKKKIRNVAGGTKADFGGQPDIQTFLPQIYHISVTVYTGKNKLLTHCNGFRWFLFFTKKKNLLIVLKTNSKKLANLKELEHLVEDLCFKGETHGECNAFSLSTGNAG